MQRKLKQVQINVRYKPNEINNDNINRPVLLLYILQYMWSTNIIILTSHPVAVVYIMWSWQWIHLSETHYFSLIKSSKCIFMSCHMPLVPCRGNHINLQMMSFGSIKCPLCNAGARTRDPWVRSSSEVILLDCYYTNKMETKNMIFLF